MKKKYVVVTILTVILSLVTFNFTVFAVEDTEQTRVSVGFSNEKVITTDKPTTVPPTGGQSSHETSQHKPTHGGRLPQTGELVNYWLIFNGCLLALMMLFIYGITRNNDEEKDTHTV